jgi:CBS domain-containing protein
MRRSILTEKISRRGLHLSREYSVDPLETVFVRDVMRTNVAVLPMDVSVQSLGESLKDAHRHRGQRLYPVVDQDHRLAGVIAASELERALESANTSEVDRPLMDLVRADPVLAYTDEPLRAVVYRMAESGKTRLPVVESDDSQRLAGLISIRDLLHARARALDSEVQRERVLRVHFMIPARARRLMSRSLSRTSSA